MRRGGNRVDQIMGDPRLPADPVKRSRGAVVGLKGKVTVKLINALHRLVRDGVRVDMAVRVKDPAGDLFIFGFHRCNVLPMWILQIREQKEPSSFFPLWPFPHPFNTEESVQKFIQSVSLIVNVQGHEHPAGKDNRYICKIKRLPVRVDQQAFFKKHLTLT